MQLIARLMDQLLAARGERATIVGATSGDTGGAAVEAFRGRSHVDVVVLFPHGRISDVQRRMMTTVPDDNVHAIAIEGTFDDCQALVKGLFNHHAFRDRVRLSGVNSINWARVVAQVVYYFTAAATLGAPHRKVAFTVPTGNFGDVFAGYVAQRMGLPIDRLTIATNLNDILVRTLATGAYELRDVTRVRRPWTSRCRRTSSGCCSGRQRYAGGARPDGVAWRSRAASHGHRPRSRYSAGRADEDETAATIRTVRKETGYLLDPHGAVGVAVAEKESRDPALPMVVLGTAHPAKFPDAVAAACGAVPSLPDWLADLGDRPERVHALPADQGAVEHFILAASRAAQEGAAA